VTWRRGQVTFKSHRWDFPHAVHHARVFTNTAEVSVTVVRKVEFPPAAFATIQQIVRHCKDTLKNLELAAKIFTVTCNL